MDLIWKTLPRDILPGILRHLDAATRRDLGMKPQKLLAAYTLNISPKTIFDTFSTVHITKDDTDIHLMCTDDFYSYSRTRRVPFMNVNGVQVYHTVDVSNELTIRN